MSGKRNWGNWRRDGHEPPPIAEGAVKVPSKFWKKKYACKKNKGDHTYEVDLIKYTDWHQAKDGTWEHPREWSSPYMFKNTNYELPYWVQWRCTGCTKKDYEWHKLDKKFDKFRHTINEKTTPTD